MKTVGFRVDVATHIGTGHLQRCITLAKEFKKLSIDSIFFVREFDESFFKIIVDSDFRYKVIGNASVTKISENHCEWLGVSQQQDAEDFLHSISNSPINALIIDHYSIAYIWQDIVRKHHLFPIVIIDDLANRVHHCDLLIDQNLWPKMQDRYDDLIPLGCLRLLGPEYALLKPQFHKLRKLTSQNKHESKKVLVNFGGVGNIDLWCKVIPALIDSNKFNFHIITGKLPSNDYKILSNLVSDSTHIYIEESTSQMAELMSKSNYCLGACGSTVWERFCLGINSALVDIADNQTELVNYLYQQNLIDYLGNLQSISYSSVYNFLQFLEINDETYNNRRYKIMSLVDGFGAKKVAASIINIT